MHKKILQTIIFIIFWNSDVLPKFALTTGKKMRDYHLKTSYIEVASRVAERLKT